MDTLADFITKYGTKGGTIMFLLALISIPGIRSALSGLWKRMFPDNESRANARKLNADADNMIGKSWQEIVHELRTQIDEIKEENEIFREKYSMIFDENITLRGTIEELAKHVPPDIAKEIIKK